MIEEQRDIIKEKDEIIKQITNEKDEIINEKDEFIKYFLNRLKSMDDHVDTEARKVFYFLYHSSLFFLLFPAHYGFS